MYVFAILWPKLVCLCMCVLCVIGGQGKEGGMKELKRYILIQANFKSTYVYM